MPTPSRAFDDNDDDDLDLPLDLHELDPIASTTAPTRSPPQRRRSSLSRLSYDFGNRIPLRNLRFGGRRRPPDELTEADADDLQALVDGDRNEEEAEAQSGGKSGAAGDGDEWPLLASNGSLSRLSQQAVERDWRWGIRRYLPFSSHYRRGHGSIALPFASEPAAADSTTTYDEDDRNGTGMRTIRIGPSSLTDRRGSSKFPPNAISNAKYTAWSFLPRTLFNEFKFFLNSYFLLVALSQIVPALRIGYLTTYIAPLAFVVGVTLGKEAWDDVGRRRRDAEANAEAYRVLRFDEESGVSGRGVEGGRKRKIKSTSKRKRGKRRKVMPDDTRLAGIVEEEERTQDVDAGSSGSVTEVVRPARDLKVGDVLVLSKDQRVPADVIILKSFSTDVSATRQEAASNSDDTLLDMGESATSTQSTLNDKAAHGKQLENKTTSLDPSAGGEAFIRTDQLDGETDWKLRLATPLAQTLPVTEYSRLQVTAGKPDKRVNDFIGTIELLPKTPSQAYHPPRRLREGADAAPNATTINTTSTPLTIDNTAWANTVLASASTIHAVVIYTGAQTRSALSTSPSRSKTGLLELEINSLTKILCALTATLSFTLVALEGFNPHEGRAWYVAVMRFLILFSTIVPISLRVNLDMGKSVFAWLIHRDKGIPATVVRTSTIPEDLGRIEYLLTDKTGTLTRNEMELRKVHVGTVGYGAEAMEEVATYVRQGFAVGDESGDDGEDLLFTPSKGSTAMDGATTTTRTRREIGGRVRDLVLALALCHNVTPISEQSPDGRGLATTAYQASSPDEIAIVQWTERIGLRLAHRDRRSITLQSAEGDGRTLVRVEILNVFPFTSDSKRMGIIVRFIRRANASRDEEGDIVFFQKGADTVMGPLVAANDWLDEETGNMAREGLRALVIGRKLLTSQQYSAFSAAYSEAGLDLRHRDAALAKAVKQHLEHSLELLGVTGVEDKLQAHVKPSLELLRNAGIKIWMLTGDKVETARCVAISSKLVSRRQHIHTIADLRRKEAALDALAMLHAAPNAALLIDGASLALYLQHHREAFITTAVRLPAVIACRCSPTQKADVARLIRAHTHKRILCIGDGGNDVSMIQAADIGVGIEGKEGRQASLAADFSITQFAHLTKLLVWHGRNSYKRSAKLAQFVIHRGLLISVCQALFSIASRFEPVALYRDWLLVGYATVYTMAPVFSLVLDRDVDEALANLYPELYKELTAGRSLSFRSFFVWVGVSLYQGLIIQGGSELLVPGYRLAAGDPTPTDNPEESQGFKRMVALSYTALILNELLMVACSVTTWHPVMIFSIMGTAAVYFGSLPFLGEYYDLAFLLTLGFWWRCAAVCAASLVPVWLGTFVGARVRPPSYRKVRAV